jgi:hypothetical protein
MSKLNFILVSFIVFSFNVFAQSKIGIYGNDWTENWHDFQSNQTRHPLAKIILSGNITKNTTLVKTNFYLLAGDVYVTNNATLTIEPGTVIRGDFETSGTLIITQNSKIYAIGKPDEPIVFTSNKDCLDRKDGDWGGIVILGNAPLNILGGTYPLDFENPNSLCKFGGNDITSDSGVLKYVRIEYAGRSLNKNKSMNTLILAGVGSKTKIENLQISHSNKSAVDVRGGNLNLSNLITYKSAENDLKVSLGSTLYIFNSLMIRKTSTLETGMSRCIEVSSVDIKENTDFSKNHTNVFAKNLSLVNISKDNFGNLTEAILIKDKSKLVLENNLISGFNPVMKLSTEVAIMDNFTDFVVLRNNILNNCENIIKAKPDFNHTANLENELADSLNNKYTNKITTQELSSLLINIKLNQNPDFRMVTDEFFTKN